MKQNRHQKIAELVSRYEIETQEELAEKLKVAVEWSVAFFSI